MKIKKSTISLRISALYLRTSAWNLRFGEKCMLEMKNSVNKTTVISVIKIADQAERRKASIEGKANMTSI